MKATIYVGWPEWVKKEARSLFFQAERDKVTLSYLNYLPPRPWKNEYDRGTDSHILTYGIEGVRASHSIQKIRHETQALIPDDHGREYLRIHGLEGASAALIVRHSTTMCRGGCRDGMLKEVG